MQKSPSLSSSRSLARRHSLTNFNITSRLLRILLTRHCIQPSFLDLLFGLRAREELSEKAYGPRLTPAGDGSLRQCAQLGAEQIGLIRKDICYQLRYMEPKEHDQGRRWSERQIGVYHSFDPRRILPATVILLHATRSSRLQQRVENAFEDGLFTSEIGSCHMTIHLMILSTYLSKWRWYMDELGLDCLDLVSEWMMT